MGNSSVYCWVLDLEITGANLVEALAAKTFESKFDPKSGATKIHWRSSNYESAARDLMNDRVLRWLFDTIRVIVDAGFPKAITGCIRLGVFNPNPAVFVRLDPRIVHLASGAGLEIEVDFYHSSRGGPDDKSIIRAPVAPVPQPG